MYMYIYVCMYGLCGSYSISVSIQYNKYELVLTQRKCSVKFDLQFHAIHAIIRYLI